MVQLIFKREKSSNSMLVSMNCYVNDIIVCHIKNGQETSCSVNNGILNIRCGFTHNRMSDVIYIDATNKNEIRILIKQGFWKPMIEVVDKPFFADCQKKQSFVRKNKRATFIPTTKVGSYFALNDETKQWAVRKGILPTFKHADVYDYKDILDFELLEDGTSIIRGGLAGAVAGGILFGGVGAIVGGLTDDKKIHKECSSLKVKITLNRLDIPAIYINLISRPIEKGYETYKNAYNNAQKILSLLQIICNQVMEDNSYVENINYFSPADEIRKFKQLFDDGIISEEEFNTKKKQLLEQ